MLTRVALLVALLGGCMSQDAPQQIRIAFGNFCVFGAAMMLLRSAIRCGRCECVDDRVVDNKRADE